MLTRRVKQLSLPGCEETPTHGTGGTTGGAADDNIRTVFVWNQGTWGPDGPPEAEVFWSYWLSDDIVDDQLENMERLNGEIQE